MQKQNIISESIEKGTTQRYAHRYFEITVRSMSIKFVLKYLFLIECTTEFSEYIPYFTYKNHYYFENCLFLFHVIFPFEGNFGF